MVALLCPKLFKKIVGQGFHTDSCHCKRVSSSICLSEGATVTKGAGLTDRSVGCLTGVRFSADSNSALSQSSSGQPYGSEISRQESELSEIVNLWSFDSSSGLACIVHI